MRASDIRFLNDSREFSLGWELCWQLVSDRADTASDERFWRGVKKVSEDPLDETMPFVTCFSEDGDQVPQWRAYTKHADGYSIGFHTAGIPIGEAVLAKVEYDTAGQRSLVQDFLRRFREAVQRSIEGADRDTTRDAMSQAASVAATVFVVMALVFKHESFAHELEWRLIQTMHRSNEAMNRIQFRASRGIAVPYVNIPLVKDAGVAPISRVIVGPTVTLRSAVDGVRALLRKMRITDDVPVTRSQSSLVF